MTHTKTILTIFFLLMFFADSIMAVETKDKHPEHDFHKGQYTPPGDYILSGQFIKDLPDPIGPKVDYSAPGFRGDRLSKVPPAGVHPRLIISPSDIDRMKEMVKMGEKAPLLFRVTLQRLYKIKDWKIPQNYNYTANPFGQDSQIAQWAFLALLTDDEELGKKAAKAAVDKALYMEPRIDLLNTRPEAKAFKDNSFDFNNSGFKFGPYSYGQAYYQGGKDRIDELVDKYGVKIIHSADASGANLSLAWDYDYAHPFMTEKQREIVRRVISKLSYGKYDSGMSVPPQMYINNHMSIGTGWVATALAIEGEEGYDERIYPIALWSMQNKLTHELSPEGIVYENTKGYIPAIITLALARRQGADHPENVLKHSHFLARANASPHHARKIYNRYINRCRHPKETKHKHDVKTGLDEKRFWEAYPASGSGGHIELWHLLKYFYPDSPLIDFAYNVEISRSYLDTYQDIPGADVQGKHNFFFNLPVLTMLTASDLTDYNKVDELKQFESLPKFWFDEERGMVSFRNSWDQDSMLVHMENRTGQYYGGHESPQQGDFQVWADGIAWSPNLGPYFDTTFRTMVSVDGMAGVHEAVSGDSLTVENTSVAANSVAEMTTSYQWRKVTKLLHLDHPGIEQVPEYLMEKFATQAYLQDRFTELPYLPKIRKHYDGFAHLDYGPWHGETRGMERYKKWNDPMDHVFRTLHFARGDRPYLLVFDDLQKVDDMDHQFDWRMMLTGDSSVYSINAKASKRHLQYDTTGAIGTDIILTMANDTTSRSYTGNWTGIYNPMRTTPQKGDPMLLIRVLWRNTNYPYPIPNVQHYLNYKMLSIPAYSKSPEYKVMIMPYHFGEKLPLTLWSDDMSELTIKAGGNVDVYQFGKTDRKRTVYSMTRNGEKIIDSKATPPKPMLVEASKWTVDQNRPEWRQPRVIDGPTKVTFQPIAAAAEIRYTFDGSEPTENSHLYNGEIIIDESITLKTRSYLPVWNFGPKPFSSVASFAFQKQTPAKAKDSKPSMGGLIVAGYEVKTTMFDEKGFFQGSKSSMPYLSYYKPSVRSVCQGFDIPAMDSRDPGKMMNKGFYVFEGYYHAPADGVYGFEVESCGPVDFKIGDRQVILVDKQYGLSYKKRYGQMALKKGAHKLYLLACDTMFWKGDAEEPYVINVAAKEPGNTTYVAINPGQLSCDAPLAMIGPSNGIDSLNIPVRISKQGVECQYSIWKLPMQSNQNPISSGKLACRSEKESIIAISQPGYYLVKAIPVKGGKAIGQAIEKRVTVLKAHSGRQLAVLPGMVEKRFDRIALSVKQIPASGLPVKYFDTTDLRPYTSATVNKMRTNDSTRKLVEYQGMLRIVQDGIYSFKFRPDTQNSAQLLINDELVVRQRVDGPRGPGKVFLGRGMHPIRYQLASGKATVYIKAPGQDGFQILDASAIARPATPVAEFNGKALQQNDVEIFKSQTLILSSPIPGATVKYGLGNAKPTIPYSKPLKIDATTKINTQLVKDRKAIGQMRTLSITRSLVPTAGMLAYLDCELIDKEGLTEVKFGKGATAVVTEGLVEPGKKGSALGFYEPASQLGLRDLQTHEDAVTLSAWIKVKDDKQDFYVITGALYKNDCYVLRFRGNHFLAEFRWDIGTTHAPLDTKLVAPGEWFHVATTYGDEICVYLNGELIGSAPVQNKTDRRGSGLEPNLEMMLRHNPAINAALDEARIYDRVLSSDEIKALYNADK